MATQNYRPRGEGLAPGEMTNDATHPTQGTAARKTLSLNSGNPTAGPVKTIAPIKAFDPTAKDHTWGRDSGNPGSNGFSGASSLSPNVRTVDVAAAAQPDRDVVKEQIIARRQADIEHDGANVGNQLLNSQTRDITENRQSQPRERQVATHSGTSGASPGGTVPAKLGATESPAPAINAYDATKSG